MILLTTTLTRLCGIPDVITSKQQLLNSKVSSINSQVLRVVDGNRTNTKLTNKNNIINGTNQLNYQQIPNSNYQTANLTTQQFTNLQNELNNNQSPKSLITKHQQKDELNKSSISLSNIFNQFTELITLEELEDQNENLNTSKNTAILLNLNCDFTSKSKWEAILYEQNLYLQIPADILFETSKEAFVNLLEYAEEELKCQNVVICLDKNSVEKSNSLIRMFMYFGFSALSPTHPLTPKNASDTLLFMAYSFE